MSAATTTPHTSWPTVKLGDVCELNRGLTYKKTDEVLDSSIKVLRSNNIDLESNSLDLSEVKCLRDDLKIAKDKFVLKDSILMCMANGSKIHLGKVALIDTDELFAFGGFMGLLVPKGINPKFLYFTLCSPIFKDYVGALQDGANINNLKFSDISNYPILLPPLEVQREIVAKVEAGLKEADGLVAHFKRLAALADDTFKAELDETFSTLNAPTVKLGDVCEEIRERISTDVISLETYITTDNMLKSCGGVRVAESLPPNTSLVHYKTGDVLLSNIRPYLKKLWCATCDGGCSSDVIVFRSSRDDLDSNYLYQVLSQEAFFDYVMQNVSGTKMPRGKREWIKDFTFPLPSLDIQREIVGKLEAVKARCEQLKGEAARGLKAAEALRKAVLAEAFEQ